ncbi:MAG: hypothetical protein K1X83_05845 [Oligoflexia bacterium]|nr:hypothetical protein [Oligoflexia bacterium]
MSLVTGNGPRFSPSGPSGSTPRELKEHPELAAIRPAAVGQFFADFCNRPCKAGGEEIVIAKLVEFAELHGFEYARDDHRNLAIYVPGRGKGTEAAPVALQFHTDMVFYPEHHDFSGLGISLESNTLADGETVISSGGTTTIGADNRLGASIALALAIDDQLADRPPLVLLATSAEEIGLVGAKELKSEMLRGSQFLINLDNEKLGHVFNRCAGQATGAISMPLERTGIDESVRSDYRPILVKVMNLPGGHSGAEIHERRGNAITTLAQALGSVIQDESGQPLRVGSLAGGEARNAIPSGASAVLWIHKDEAAATIEQLERRAMAIIEATVDPVFFKSGKPPRVEIEDLSESAIRSHLPEPISPSDARALLGMLNTLKHGVLEDDEHQNPELSNNVAQILQRGQGLEVVCMTRHFDEDRCVESLTSQFDALAPLNASLALRLRSTSAGWYGGDSYRLLSVACEAYREVSGDEAIVSGIHAGVEPGEFNKIAPNMQQVSLGPTILGAHSSEERFIVGTVEVCYNQVAKMLEMLCE